MNRKKRVQLATNAQAAAERSLAAIAHQRRPTSPPKIFKNWMTPIERRQSQLGRDRSRTENRLRNGCRSNAVLTGLNGTSPEQSYRPRVSVKYLDNKPGARGAIRSPQCNRRLIPNLPLVRPEIVGAASFGRNGQ